MKERDLRGCGDRKRMEFLPVTVFLRTISESLVWKEMSLPEGCTARSGNFA